ncbi:hypothetical protein BDV98DRAFT_576044, partial [Pterulicium gracile]
MLESWPRTRSIGFAIIFGSSLGSHLRCRGQERRAHWAHGSHCCPPIPFRGQPTFVNGKVFIRIPITEPHWIDG